MESKRWNEYRTEKDLEEAADRLLSQDLEIRKKEKAKDPVLDEAVNIAADYPGIK